MIEDKLPQTLDEVREAIDGLDKGLIELLARRQKLVRQAGRLKPKNDVRAVSAPERVAQVIASRRAYAEGRFVARSSRSSLAQHEFGAA